VPKITQRRTLAGKRKQCPPREARIKKLETLGIVSSFSVVVNHGRAKAMAVHTKREPTIETLGNALSPTVPTNRGRAKATPAMWAMKPQLAGFPCALEQ
jgi:hypothetical protein